MAEPDQDDDAAEATSEDEDPSSPGLLKRLLLPISAAAVALCLAILFCFVLYPPPAGTRTEEESTAPILDEDLADLEPTVEVPLPKVIVNLADEAREQVLKTSLTAQFRAEDNAAVEKHIEKNGRAIKDALITHLSGMLSSEVKSTEGKELLKFELIELLTPLVFPEGNKGKILAVFFEEFLVQ